jgi:frizzled protein 4
MGVFHHYISMHLFLQFFLCFAYVPMCVTEATTPQMLIGPCRPLCERVRSSCLSLLEQFKYTW